MERTGVFSERTGRIFGFFLIRTDKIRFSRHYSQFRPICCRNRPLREAACHSPSPVPRTASRCSQGGRRCLPWWKIAVSQPLLNLLERHAVGKEQTSATVAQIVEAHAPQAVLLDILRKIACQIIRPHQIAQLVYKDIAVILIVVAISADLFVQLMRRLDFLKYSAKLPTSGSVRMLDLVLAESCAYIFVLPSTCIDVTVCLMVIVPRSKSIASH